MMHAVKRVNFRLTPYQFEKYAALMAKVNKNNWTDLCHFALERLHEETTAHMPLGELHQSHPKTGMPAVSDTPTVGRRPGRLVSDNPPVVQRTRSRWTAEGIATRARSLEKRDRKAATKKRPK